MVELSALGDSVKSYIANNKTGAIITGSALALGGAAVALAVSKRKSKSKSKNRKKRNNYKKAKRKKKTYKYARTARKRKDRSHRRIRMTKTGQPYIILASGKARFISKKSARISRKRKGGRY